MMLVVLLSLVAGALLGAVFSVLFQESLNSFRLRSSVFGKKSEFRGKFVETLPSYEADDGTRPDRQDRVVSRQKGQRIWGEIVRELPVDEAGKRWLFRGYVDGPTLVAAFWTKTPGRDPTSYGTFIMQRAAANKWSGRYWRPGTEPKAAIESGDLSSNEIGWQKTNG